MALGAKSAAAPRVYPMVGIGAVLVGASLATFFGRLLSVGAADLRGPLHLGIDRASWIATAYNMSLMFIGPFSVYLGGVLGPRRVLLWSAIALAPACAAMPIAGHFSSLIVLLVLAGLTAGTFYPLTLSFILRNLPQKYIHLGIAAYAFDIVATTHVAHSWEGWLMTKLSWQWIFWTIALAAPPMAAMVYWGIPRQPLPQPRPGQPRLTWRGFLFASLGAAFLYAALDQGQRLDWWRSGTFVALVVSGSFLVLCAAIRHFCQPNPLVNFPFLRRRNTVLLGLTVACFRFVLLAGVVLVPSYLAVIKGFRPEQTGPVLLWLAVPQLLAGLLAVYLMGRIDARLILATGFAMIAIGCAMNARISPAWSGNSFVFSQLILSMGEGLAFNGMVGSIILDIINSGSLEKPADVLTFAGFFQTVRLLGGEVGASFIQFFLHQRQVFHADLLLTGIEGGSEAVIARSRLLYAGMHAQAATPDLAMNRAALLFGGGLQLQAYTQAVMDGFKLIAYTATGCLLIVVCLKALRVGFVQLIAASSKESSSQS